MNKITLPQSVVLFSQLLCKLAFRNEKRISRGNKCLCYSCCSEFGKDEITHWCDCDGKGPKTAICPRCGIDSVLPRNAIIGDYGAMLKLASLVMFHDRKVSKDDLFYRDEQTGQKVFFEVIDEGDSFSVKLLHKSSD